ncbi:MAG: polymorphic toxin-type HINT domain-containing protein [Bacteroidota bacterium]
MNQAIKCYISAYGLLFLLFFLSMGQANAQTRSLQWATTNGRSTVSVDEVCPATEGYIQFAPKSLLMVGLTDDPNPNAYQDMNYCVYPYVTSSYTNLYFYKKGSYQGYTRINGAAQSTDRIKIERKGSLIKFYYNSTLAKTYELDANTIYRVFSYNYGSSTVASMSTIAERSLIEPCSNYQPGSSNILPEAKTDESHNWVHNKIFNEHGDIVGETRVYLDRLGSAVQTQTKNYATNQVIGKQLVYDGQGRNAMVSLSAPTGYTNIQYRSKFLRSAATGLAYDYSDFDTPTKKDNPSTVSSTFNTIGYHYSNSGESYVPTTSYPFSSVQFHLDGSVKKVSNVGEHYRMGSGNETEYYHTMSGGELAYLFGYRKSYEVDVPLNDPLNPVPKDIEKNILAYKTITIGSDGVEHISFSDASGKLLATAVSGQMANSNCTNQQARHTLIYRGTQSTKIHLPAATKSSLKIVYGGYLVSNDPLNNIDIRIVDLKTDQPLVEGTDFQLSLGTNSQLDVSFLGSHASNSGFYRISFDYTQVYLENYYNFFIPGYEPPVVIQYDLDYSDWTLNYYDERGRRVQSTQPKGTRCDFVDVSQMGNFPFFESFDIVSGYPATYYTTNQNIETINTPALQSGLGQEVDMSIKTMLKPGIIADHWFPDDNGGIIYEPVAAPITVAIDDNPFSTTNNPGADIVLVDMTDAEFEATYPSVAVADIETGNLAAILPPAVAQARSTNTNDDGDDIPWYCYNGYLDYGEVGIDCGGPCPACEECEEDPEFFVSYQFKIEFRGTLPGGTTMLLGDGFIYRTFGLNCNSTLIDLTDPAEEVIQIDHFVSDDVIANNNLQSVKVVLVNTMVKTDPNANYGGFNVTNEIHRFVRYVYLRLDGEREVFFDQPIPHTMKETVVYDDLNRVSALNDPDRGLIEYVYDDEGKIRFSQDARQWSEGYFSYYSYDERGRVIETGEYRGENTHFFPSSLRPISASTSSVSLYNIRNQLDGLPSTNRADQSFMVYDEQATNFPTSGATGYEAAFVEGRLAMTKNDDHTTWYKYDHKGQLVAAIQEYPEVGLKTMDYEYDCFGRLTKTIYQKNNTSEKFDHLYNYDSNGDLKTIETKKGTELPKLHASYDFYKLGQLKRTELGEDLQGIDYTYTIDGALKAINHPGINSYDPGKDGYTGSHSTFAKDVFGMAIDYHSQDYVRKSTYFNYGQNQSANDYFDGRIKSIRWKTRGGVATPSGQQHMFSYEYDWKQQLTGATYGWYAPNNTTNNISGIGGFSNPAHGAFLPNSNQAYKVQNISYDQNGNILSLHRKNDTGEDLDNMTYVYEHPDFSAYNGAYTTPTNKLRYVIDAAGFLDQNDVQNQQVNNYNYNDNGEIQSDKEKDISLIYNSFGKVDEIRNYLGTKLVMSFTYDEYGQRIAKTTYDASGNPEKATLYVREPGGTVAATYEKEYTVSSPTYGLSEYMLDGGQLGIFYPAGIQYVYHLSDHLGNVRATINRDKDASGEAELLSFADYYPYGMVMPGHEQASSPRYRLGYQGKELDAKVGLYAFQLRMYDPRLGKWLSPDPYDQHWSPYLAMSNNPISFIDPDGGWDDPYEIQMRIEHYMRMGDLDGLENYLWRMSEFTNGESTIINSTIMGYNSFMASVESWAAANPDEQYTVGIRDGQLGVWVREDNKDVTMNTDTNMRSGTISKEELEKLGLSDDPNFIRILEDSGPEVIEKFYASNDVIGGALNRRVIKTDQAQPQPKKSRWSRALDWVQTGLDVVGLVPGLGEVADGVNALIYLGRGDYTNAALSAAAMVPLAGAGATAAKYINKSGLLDDAAGAVLKRGRQAKGGKPGCNCPGNGKCFTAGTLILTQEGYVPIEHIALGDSVWAYNEISKERELKPVIDVFQREAEEIIRLTIGEEEIAVTAEHPFYSGGYWREAGQLTKGDTILLFDGTPEVVTDVKIEKGSFKVYNFEVEDWHSYYVAETSILVHNAGCDVERLRTGGNDTAVNVKTKAEADALLNEAFPDYQKVNGVGPQSPSGIRKKRKMERFKKGGAYHKDYHIDPATGRVKGHGANNAHGTYPHINIKRKDGKKVIINITGD